MVDWISSFVAAVGLLFGGLSVYAWIIGMFMLCDRALTAIHRWLFQPRRED